MALEIRLLGPIAATLDGQPVALGARKQRAVLAMLALEPGRTVSTDRLVRGLWGDAAPDTAPKMVQAYVSRLRKALPQGDALIATHGHGYELSLPADAVDALRLERLVADAARVENSDVDRIAREAIGLWRGPPLVDVQDEPFAAPEIARLEELWLRAKELSIDAELALGRHGDALSELGPLVTRYPLRERLHGQRMVALYRSGRQADALAAYRHARKTLVDEIGVEPGRELQRLHEAILNQDPALDAKGNDGGAPSPAPLPAGPEHEAAPERAAAAAVQPARGRLPQRALFAAAAAAVVASAVAFALTRGGDDQTLPGIDEDTVAVLAPDGKHLGERYQVGHAPVALALGAGYVWAANESDGTVTRIDPRSGRVLTIDVGGDPVKVTFGAGSVWVADGRGRSVTQVNPGGARIVQRIDVGGGPRGLAVGAGDLWVATALDGAVQRVDLAKGRVTQQIPVSSTPTDVAFGAGGLWVASETGGTALRIEPRSGRVLDAVNVGNGPASIAIGAGAVWTANRQDNTISRIDPATAAVTDTIAVGRGPAAIAVGQGVVWTANAEDGTISRVDVRSRRVTDQIEIGTTPAAVVPVGGSLWVSALPERGSHRGGTLRVRLFLPDTCGCADPIGYDGATWPLVAAAYDGLLAYRHTGGAAGATLVGDLAVGVPRPRDEGRTYAFRLRPGIRYSDGTPLRAADVRASLERLLSVQAGAIPNYFSALPGARECIRGVVPCDLSKAIEVDERARAVTFHLLRPDAELLPKLALPLAAILPADAPRRVAKGVPPPGTGPYRFASFDGHRGARLERNPHFTSWSADARPEGFADSISVTFTAPKAGGEAAAIEHGNADVAVLPVGAYDPGAHDRIRGLLASRTARLVPGRQLETEFMFLNVRVAPFDDVRVRRAVNFATDRRHVAELAGGPEIAHPTCQILPPGMPGYRPFCPWTLDPSPAGEWTAPDLVRAKRLVAASGTRGQRVVVWIGRESSGVARYYVGLMRRLGFRSAIRVLPSYPAYFAAIADSRQRAQMGLYGWSADYVAPSNMIAPQFTCAERIPRSPQNSDVAQFCDPGLDAMINRVLARPAADPSTTASLWHAIDRRVVAAAPVVPLINRGDAVLIANRVGNVQQHPFWGTLLDQLWVR